jgi:hypothetical protein
MFELAYARGSGEVVVVNVETLEFRCELSQSEGG